MSMSMTATDEKDWIKIDLHIHTLDDPKDAVDFSAHQLLERARSFGFRVLAITLHDAVFDRKEVFADAAAMGILLIPAAEVRLLGADVIVLNVTAEEIAQARVTRTYVGGELVYNLGTQVDRHAWRGGGTKWTALDVTDLPADKPVKAKAGAQTLVVVRRGKGLDALHDVCAHQGCSLSEGKIVGDTIECPCHGSRYRLRDGIVVRGPAVFDQPHFEVREAEGKIEVRRTDTR